ncbi:hypothetical protein GF312_03025 [Candidatus Poribacteria bacterium]|nr:hypothetical protein [Candidatus Poribacteria bacterium]
MFNIEFSDDMEFTIASFTYIMAHVVDYLFTISGVELSPLNEGNLIIRNYMNMMGIEQGLLFYKGVMCAGVILGMKAVQLSYRKRNIKFKVQYILYGGAVATTLGGTLWLFKL